MVEQTEGEILVIENPNNPQHRERAPLILIHDGGGTIFNYYMIGMLGRPVYGIPDPRFGTESPWEDGIPQMARCYSDLIRSNIRSRQVLLGGWSLGGLIALEIARLLVESSDLQVDGVLLIDSYYPRAFPDFSAMERHNVPGIDSVSKNEMKERTEKSLQEAKRIITAWKMEGWPGMSASNVSQDYSHSRTTLPSTVLLRAINSMPLVGSHSPNHISAEMSRDNMHGWSHLRIQLIKQVYDISAHHFDIFDSSNVKTLTQLIMNACDYLGDL